MDVPPFQLQRLIQDVIEPQSQNSPYHFLQHEHLNTHLILSLCKLCIEPDREDLCSVYPGVRSVAPYIASLYSQRNLGSEIYVGCSNGELLRFALQADDPTKVCPVTLA
jgi:hypothetical protein